MVLNHGKVSLGGVLYNYCAPSSHKRTMGGYCIFVLAQLGVVSLRERERISGQVDLFWLSESICRGTHRADEQEVAPLRRSARQTQDSTLSKKHVILLAYRNLSGPLV